MDSTPSFSNDRLLWQDFLAGEVRAFEKLMSDNFRLLFQYGCKFSKDRELVKDSIQDLFLVLWEKRGNLNPDAAVKPYLMASLRRLMHRQVSSRAWVGGEALQEEDDYFDIEFSVEDEYIANEAIAVRSGQLEKLLNALPRRQKEVVYLKFFQELSREQIAEVMAISPQTVSNLLQIAIKHLKAHWKAGFLLFFLLHFLL
ncbi:sigma-70 family RNA polymerase sigma factor [Dyadobacter sp. CY261]|uniref:RNA polymerase sigma factor n=1 Tax=Dyadobacter sp. CY261 TaxID=2907203 RepID=UPI001F37C1E0|nr:sigma-70 family RNA polymerase sigma factor [Dyadobacter sp. CY261]MCF0074605.1 sigma-70 family RNA polymerase sigma factor [Dyadobacter sp. CY261]